MINRRFLNYKQYQSFLNDLNDGQILRDAIVFIQDESHPCIYTHGKEYLCNVGKSSLDNGKLVFDDGFGNSTFTIEQKDGTITITDSDGNSSSATYVLDEDFQQAITNIENTFNQALEDMDNNALKASHFKTITTQKAQNVSLIGKGTIDATIDIDEQLNADSSQPVQNSAITTEFGKKQNKLVQGTGISIQPYSDGREKISSTLDVEPFVILTQAEFPPSNPSSNKIYIVVENVDGTSYRYVQYIYRNGQWVATDNMAPEVDLSSYLTINEAANTYQVKGDYVTNTGLQEYVNLNIIPVFSNYYTKTEAADLFQPIGDYATKQWSDERYVKRVEVYTPEQGDLGTNGQSDGQVTPTPSPSVIDIVVDNQLSLISTNPVQNRVITRALEYKVDTTTLSSYATKEYVTNQLSNVQVSGYITDSDLDTALQLKQDVLTAGKGIAIVNNVVSCTLDTGVFEIVETLPSNPDPNKIYLLYTVEGNTYTYYEYRWDGSEWHNNGEREPNINLGEYLKSSVAADTYQLKGSYVETSQLDDYVSTTSFDDYKAIVDTVYQKKGDYASKDYVSRAIEYVQGVIDRKYVLKKDVYRPTDMDDWSTEAATPLDITSGDSEGSGNGAYTHIFLEQSQYDALPSYDNNTIYFIYEESDDQPSDENWHFGDLFPIILT